MIECSISTFYSILILKIVNALEALGLVIVPFTVEEAELAARLWKATRQYGLSLRDRACLSSALCLNLPVYTADRIWLELDLPIEVHCVR